MVHLGLRLVGLIDAFLNGHDTAHVAVGDHIGLLLHYVVGCSETALRRLCVKLLVNEGRWADKQQGTGIVHDVHRVV
ncbi:hypothetical protein D3C71_1957260 [compost metagenome]